MLEHVWNNIILLNLRDFENIGVDFYINIFFFFAALAIMLVAFFFDYSRGVTYVTVKQLVRHGALSKETSVSLSDIGLDKNVAVRFFLSRDSELSKLVSRLSAPTLDYCTYIKMKSSEKRKLLTLDFEKERFFLSGDRNDRVNKVMSVYSFSLTRFILFCVFVFLLWGVVSAFSYEIIAYLDANILGVK